MQMPARPLLNVFNSAIFLSPLLINFYCLTAETLMRPLSLTSILLRSQIVQIEFEAPYIIHRPKLGVKRDRGGEILKWLFAKTPGKKRVANKKRSSPTITGVGETVGCKIPQENWRKRGAPS